MTETYHVQIHGRVQGVGFRPFLYRLAQEEDLAGWVRNHTDVVSMEIEGNPEACARMLLRIQNEAPTFAKVRKIDSVLISTPHPKKKYTRFDILPSIDSAEQHSLSIPPDQYLCIECRDELLTESERRYHYPLINCTQCGPRYSILRNLPYDRTNTSMAPFPLCSKCETEYTDPQDRRFHAQPLTCPDCGPSIHFLALDRHEVIERGPWLTMATQRLRAGQILAIKGIGGFLLMCDAAQVEAIQRLRVRKHRPDKPLAVMFPEGESNPLSEIEAFFDLSTSERKCLASPERPIVILRPNSTSLPWAQSTLAPDSQTLGVMLPNSPLHLLLSRTFGKPLVVTSANRHGDPILNKDAEAVEALREFSDALVTHGRAILRPLDDGVYRSIAGTVRPLRQGRGKAPIELNLPHPITEPVFAAGSHGKNTVALAWDTRLIQSGHIGDLSSAEALQRWNNTQNDLQQLYGLKVKQWACDAHPDYAGSRALRAQLETSGKLPTPIWHHHAHASALVLDVFQDDQTAFSGPWLMVCWDGFGLGEDHTLWGGEFLFGSPGKWQRMGHLSPAKVVGGERISRNAWQAAACYAWSSGTPFSTPPIDGFEITQYAWNEDVGTQKTTSAGRLFDAISYLLGFCEPEQSYEGQAAIQLEHASQNALDQDATPTFLRLPVDRNNDAWQLDWSPLIPWAMQQEPSSSTAAHAFHKSLAQGIIETCRQIMASIPDAAEARIGLCGGVFQNRILSEMVLRNASAEGYDVSLHQRIPANDAAVSCGQVVEMLYRNQPQD